MTDLTGLQKLIEPVVETMGFELVRVSLFENPTLTLQVMVEDPKTGQMLVDDCARVSRALSAMLDEADPIESEYMLEVSSPGIDRPLTRLKDYDRWAGHLAKVELSEPQRIEGADRKRFQGALGGVEGSDIVIEVEGLGTMLLAFEQIATAKLLLTDRLIEASQPLSAEGVDEIVEEELAPDEGEGTDEPRTMQ